MIRFARVRIQEKGGIFGQNIRDSRKRGYGEGGGEREISSCKFCGSRKRG